MFGKITLSFEPAEQSSREASLEMQFSSEATLPEILKHFENFLRAMEYPLDSDSELIVNESEKTVASEVRFDESLNYLPLGYYGPTFESLSF